MSVNETRLHRSEHRISAANTSFIADRSSLKRGMTFVRPALLLEASLDQVGGAAVDAVTGRQTQVRQERVAVL